MVHQPQPCPLSARSTHGGYLKAALRPQYTCWTCSAKARGTLWYHSSASPVVISPLWSAYGSAKAKCGQAHPQLSMPGAHAREHEHVRHRTSQGRPPLVPAQSSCPHRMPPAPAIHACPPSTNPHPQYGVHRSTPAHSEHLLVGSCGFCVALCQRPIQPDALATCTSPTHGHHHHPSTPPPTRPLSPVC